MVSTAPEDATRRISEAVINIDNRLSISEDRTVPANNSRVRGDDILIGVGLLSKNDITEGLNPSFLGQAVLAVGLQNTIRAAGGEGAIHVIVGDEHAAVAVDRQAFKMRILERVTTEVAEILQELFTVLDTHVAVHLASELAYFTDSYEGMQTEAVDALVDREGIGVKVGWKSRRSGVRDEKWFDEFHRNEGQYSLAYLYGVEGLSMTRTEGNTLEMVPPYINRAGTNPMNPEPEFHLGKIESVDQLLKYHRDQKGSPQQVLNQLENYFKRVGKALSVVKNSEDAPLNLVNEVLASLAK